jgi:hypothetical protein
MNTQDLQDLARAHRLLHSPSIAMQAANLIGKPLERGIKMLPKGAQETIVEVTKDSLEHAMSAAIFTMEDAPKREASPWWHKLTVAGTGAVSGAFGLPALAVELPISTVIMLRSIVDIARSEGESDSDDNSDGGYYATRLALARLVSESIEHLAGRALAEGGAPVLIKLITTIAERFSIQVTEKFLAQSVPIIGAIGGATINTLFIDHFQNMARGHFIVRRLERKYGEEAVKQAFLSLTLHDEDS